MFKKKRKMKYVAKILKRVGGSYEVLKEVEIEPDQVSIEYSKEKAVPIDFSHPIRDGDTYWFLFDIDGTQIILKEGMASPMSPEMYKKIVRDKIASQLIGDEHRSKFDWERFLFGVTVGAVAAFFIAFFLGGVIL